MARPVRDSFRAVTKEVLDEMTETMSDNQIAKVLGGCTKNNVGNYRRRLGVKSYGEKNGIQVGVKGVSNPTNKKHFFNERFFSCIDSEIKAYALGLLITDGHVTKAGHRVRFSLTEADFYVIEQIAQAADFQGSFVVDPPREGNYQAKNMKVLNFNSTVMAQDLAALGIASGKDNNVILPVIPPQLECHLVRGIIDGDGCILDAEHLSRHCLLEVSGREAFLNSINDCLARHNLNPLSISKMRSIHRGRSPLADIALLDWCYGCNPSIALKRKLQRYQDAKALHDLIFKVQ